MVSSGVAVLEDLEMRVRRYAAIDRQDVHGASRKNYDEVHFSSEQYVVSGFRHRRLPTEAAVRPDRNVHPHVERTWHTGRRETQLGHCAMKVVGAVLVIPLVPQQLIAIAIASGHQSVVNSGGAVLEKCNDRSAPVCSHGLPHSRHDVLQQRARVLHGHKLAEVLSIEGPSVDDLRAVRVDHADPLPLGDSGCLALARGNFLEHCRQSSFRRRAVTLMPKPMRESAARANIAFGANQIFPTWRPGIGATTVQYTLLGMM